MPPLIPEDSLSYIDTGNLPLGATITGVPIEYPMTHLHQESPFNEYCPIVYGSRHYPAGCGPVAFVIYLSRFKYPPTPHGVQIYWDFSAGEDSAKIQNFADISNFYCN